LFDAILADGGITVVRSGVQVPRMNAIMEWWVRTCRRELLDRTLIWSRRHLLHTLRAYGTFYNAYRPHQGIANPDHSHRSPNRSPNRTNSASYASAGAIASAASCTSTNTPLDQPGRNFRQVRSQIRGQVDGSWAAGAAHEPSVPRRRLAVG
jgi:hypothetical protein